MDIVDALGNVVVTLADTDYPAGYHDMIWNGRDFNNNELANGTYTVKLTSGGVTSAYPMVIIK